MESGLQNKSPWKRKKRKGMKTDLIILLALVGSAHSAFLTFEVPDSPLIVQEGEDAVLLCLLPPDTNAEEMEVRWYREPESLVHSYMIHRDVMETQSEQYRGRTSLSREELKKGNVSLQLRDVRSSDEGSYSCCVLSAGMQCAAEIQLKVVALFAVEVPAGTVSALVGEDTVLPCQLNPGRIAVGMKVRWSRDGSEAPVLCYQRGEEVTEAQHEDYRHRARLPEAELSRGNVSLLLSSTRVTDQGTYTCSVSTQSRSQQAAVQLQLTAQGSPPSVSLLEAPARGGLCLLCVSEGWYPPPELLWTDERGSDWTAHFNSTEELDSRGLVTVRSQIHLPWQQGHAPQQQNTITCVVRSKDGQIELKAAFREPGPATVLGLALFSAAVTRPFSPLLCSAAYAKAAADRQPSVPVYPVVKGKAALLLSLRWWWRRQRQLLPSPSGGGGGGRGSSCCSAPGKGGRAPPFWLRRHGLLPPLLAVKAAGLLPFWRRRRQGLLPSGGGSSPPSAAAGTSRHAPSASGGGDRGSSCCSAPVVRGGGGGTSRHSPSAGGGGGDRGSSCSSAPTIGGDGGRTSRHSPSAGGGGHSRSTFSAIKQYFVCSLSSAKVTLNPDTASPSLTVSEDGSQVRFKGERLEEWPSVLGREGFTSGRHYWEVEVGEKGYWTLGVSTHTDEKIIPEKPEEGYWLVRRWKGNTYEAVSQSPVLLTLQHKLYKVGMILDCEKNKLSFYNVYDGCKRYKIHTFTYKFTEVYPIFSPGSHDRGPLKIIQDKSISNAPS
ncbi:butyrophilin subfamily 1 member A1-like [Huso huso]|uniref:Butyrophilin subfamily 1 member A1-like n=1 Tax=Huso huso TaxID=61971 RepID=A0ABR0Y5X6_HUSHU